MQVPGTFRPVSWTIDYESGMITALQQFPFPQPIIIHGCFFHKKQCLIRWLQEHGLKQRYENDQEFQQVVKQFFALCFVPIADIRQNFDMLVAAIPAHLQQPLTGFVDYIEVGWIVFIRKGIQNQEWSMP